MSEFSRQPRSSTEEMIIAFQENGNKPMLVAEVDPSLIKEVTQSLADTLTLQDQGLYGREFIIYPEDEDVDISNELLPLTARYWSDRSETNALVITEGGGVLEFVTGKRDAVRIEVNSGSIVLFQARFERAKTPWLRSQPTPGNEGLKGRFLMSEGAKADMYAEWYIMCDAGAVARRREQEGLDRMRKPKLRALGKLASRSQ